MYKESLDLDPLLLLITEIVRSLSLLNLLVEFIDDNRNEQVHNEEGRHENVHDEDERDRVRVVQLWRLVVAYAINRLVHHARPHL